MRLKLFRAPGMAEAIARVRAELGAEALILATRRVADGIEITAALEPEPDDDWPPAPPPPAALPREVLADALRYHGVPAALQAALLAAPLDAALAATLRFGTLTEAAAGRRLLFAGPPGAGKTLTVARLATRLVMAGILPMVVTADGRRAGGTEQLAAFTRLLGIELVVASHAMVLSNALARCPKETPVLIDAPGCDPFDPGQLEDVAALASATDADIVLVLPAGLDAAEAGELAAAFAGIGAGLLVATRLDQARRVGGVLSAAHGGGLTMTEAGIGPGAADGLTGLTAGFLAARLRTVPPLAAGPGAAPPMAAAPLAAGPSSTGPSRTGPSRTGLPLGYPA
jgi:flagellar biosynthesis protein FlhF